MADFYDFILSAMPTCAEKSDSEMRSLLLRVFAKRLEDEMRPSFEKDMLDLIPEDESAQLEEKFNFYLNWLSGFFEGFGILTLTQTEDDEYLFKFRNCPWIEEASTQPVFCLNCQAMVNQSLQWTEIEGSVDRDQTIADGGDKCIFRFKLRP
jgi:predicted ArsR family transcriptional regulator